MQARCDSVQPIQCSRERSGHEIALALALHDGVGHRWTFLEVGSASREQRCAAVELGSYVFYVDPTFGHDTPTDKVTSEGFRLDRDVSIDLIGRHTSQTGFDQLGSF